MKLQNVNFFKTLEAERIAYLQIQKRNKIKFQHQADART